MSISNVVIGRNIRKARTNACITQEQAAELLGISVLHYGRLERGERNVSLAQLSTISELFNTSIEALLLGSTDYLVDTSTHQNGLGLTIDFLAAGCSDEARSLMIDICQVIARNDKYRST